MQTNEKCVDKEFAKFLKEKGFDWVTVFMYSTEEGDERLYDSSFCMFMKETMNSERSFIAAPSYYTVLDWMRETKDMFISIAPYSKDEIDILGLPAGIKYQWSLYFDSTGDVRPYEGRGRTVEETIVDAVTHCLTDVIN